MKINIIVAHDMNRCIGKNNEIPWKIKGEQKQFKELTTGNIVIMGRKTYESIGKALPNRTNIIISRHNQHKIKDAICCKSLIKISFVLKAPRFCCSSIDSQHWLTSLTVKRISSLLILKMRIITQ